MEDVVRYVNTASTPGGNGTTNATTGDNRAYASLNEWEAAENTDLVTATNTHTVYCEGSTDDTTATVVSGWTTSSTYDITIEVTQANRHSGKWNADKYILDIDNGISLSIQEDFVNVIGLQIKGHGATTHTRKCIEVSGLGFGSDVQISNCVIYYANVNGAYSYGVDVTGANSEATLNNCLIYGDLVASAGLKGAYASGGTANLNNVTVAHGKIGIVAYNSGTVEGKNVLAYDISGEAYYKYAGCTMNLNYCADEGTHVTTYQGTGGNNRASQTGFSFVDANNRDYHLASDDTSAKDYGTSSGFSYSDDIDGDTRSGSWDIGADEYTSGATTHTKTLTADALLKATNTKLLTVDALLSATAVKTLVCDALLAAVETLRPAGAGSETGIAYQYPASGAHWEKVDEAAADGDDTYVYTNADGGPNEYQRDLYSLSAGTGSGTINKVTVFMRCKGAGGEYIDEARTAIRTHSTVYQGSEINLTGTWTLYSTEYTTNPNTGLAWTWDEIGALEAGVSINGWSDEALCAQVYVEVSYISDGGAVRPLVGGSLVGNSLIGRGLA